MSLGIRRPSFIMGKLWACNLFYSSELLRCQTWRASASQWHHRERSELDFQSNSFCHMSCCNAIALKKITSQVDWRRGESMEFQTIRQVLRMTFMWNLTVRPMAERRVSSLKRSLAIIVNSNNHRRTNYRGSLTNSISFKSVCSQQWGHTYMVRNALQAARWFSIISPTIRSSALRCRLYLIVAF